MRAEVIAIGDELTTGQRLDTNSRWISRELGLLGIPVAFHTTVSDTFTDGVAAFQAARGRAEIVISTGGLGPTADDLTRDVLAEVAGQPLRLVPEALQAIELIFASRGRAMSESNRRQALLPVGSDLIPNPEGTAPGIDLPAASDGQRAGRVFALPGVPSEMYRMWTDSVRPAVLAMLPGGGTMRFRVLKCFGAGESGIEAMLPDLIRRGRDPLVGITAHEATITLRIAARAASEEACLAAIEPVETTIRECLGDLVFGEEEDEMEDAAVRACVGRQLTVAVCEGATLGRVATLLAEADLRQAGRIFRGGQLRPIGLSSHVDLAVLAEACRREASATAGLAVGDARTDAEGAAWLPMAVSTPEGSYRCDHRLGGSGSLRLSRAAKTALDLLRRIASGLPLPPA